MTKFDKIAAPWWDDKPVAIVGGGHSLAGFDFDQLRQFHVIAVKGTMFDLPWADAGFGLDVPRYVEWAGRFKTVPFPVYWAAPCDAGKKTALIDSAEKASNVTFIKRVAGTDRLSEDPSYLIGGGTSSFAALGLAVLKRAKVIGLFGLDYNSRTDQAFHRNEQHYAKQRAQAGANWTLWASYYSLIKPQLDRMGVTVINGSPDSLIKPFKKMDPDDAVTYLSNLHRLGPARDGSLYGDSREPTTPHDGEASGARPHTW